MGADVVADMLTTKCSHPQHGVHIKKCYLDNLLPLVVTGKAVDVCYQCFKDYEADNAGAPKSEIKTARLFTACCKHFRCCNNERIYDIKEVFLERASVTAQKLYKKHKRER